MIAKWVVSVDRFFAWILFVLVLIYFVTGYGMTKGFIDPTLSANLHNNYLVWVIFIAFIVHSFLAIRMAFLRWKISTLLTLIILILFYISLITGFVYVKIFYTKNNNESDKGIISASATATSTQTIKSTSSSAEKIFNAKELSKYDGKNGQSAYVAVEGRVYDMSEVFKDGVHYGHEAGKELTNSFLSKHIIKEITKYPVVGIYQE